MPSEEVKLVQLITRLDMLDGEMHHKYHDVPLRYKNATGVCEIAIELDEQLSSELAKKGSKEIGERGRGAGAAGTR